MRYSNYSKGRLMKALAALVTALALILSLSGCGSSSKQSFMSEPQAADYADNGFYGKSEFAMEAEMPMDEESKSIRYASDSGSSPVQPGGAEQSNVKLIYRANVTVQTTDFDATVKSIEDMVSQAGGYFENSYVYNGGYYSEGTYKRGSYTVRVPSQNYRAFMDVVGNTLYVSNRNESVEDIGLQYADTEAMLETLRIKQDRLQELLAKAENMSDIIEIENALTDVEYQITRYSQTKNRYDSLIGYATVNIDVEKVERPSSGIDDEQSYLERLARNFVEGAEDFADGVGDFVLSLAYNIIPLAIAALVIALLLKKGAFDKVAGSLRERKVRSAQKKAEKAAAKAAKKQAKDSSEPGDGGKDA
jgi:hypothetical protein